MCYAHYRDKLEVVQLKKNELKELLAALKVTLFPVKENKGSPNQQAAVALEKKISDK